MRIIIGFMDTRTNNEDFALTPYLGLVYVRLHSKIYGISLTWGYHSYYIALGFNLPTNYPFLTTKPFKH